MLEIFYTKTHEWIRKEDDLVVMGITDHAQKMLGDIVFIEFPKTGKNVSSGDEVLTIESPKASAGVYSPVSGTIVEINENLESNPSLINSSPYEEGWILKIRPDDMENGFRELLTEEKYQKII